jgi:hypothetical protein
MSFDPVMPPYNASDPTARFLSSSCLDFLCIELVPMAYRVTRELDGVAREQEEGLGSGEGEGLEDVAIDDQQGLADGNGVGDGSGDGSGVGGVDGGGGENGEGGEGGEGGNGGAAVIAGSAPGSASGPGLGIVAEGGRRSSTTRAAKGTGTETVMDEEEEREAVFRRLEGIGYRVGQGLVERYVYFVFRGCMGCWLLDDWLYNRRFSQSPAGSGKLAVGEQKILRLTHPDSPVTGHASMTRSTSSNSSAKTSGHWLSGNKSTILRRTTVYVSLSSRHTRLTN